jgi:hypothetical protein
MSWCPSTLARASRRQAEHSPGGESLPAGGSNASLPTAIQRWPLRIYAYFEATPSGSSSPSLSGSDDSIRSQP